MKIRNTFIIFIVSGFWHGANWTFIVWGALNAIYFLPLLLTNRNRSNLEIVAQGKLVPSMKEIIQILTTFGLTIIAWVFFRAENVTHAMAILSEIFSSSLFSFPSFTGMSRALTTLCIVSAFVLVEWFGREGEYAIERLGISWRRSLRYSFYYTIILFILFFSGKEQDFIYFQF